MMRRLLDRNIATLVVVVLVGQLLAAALLYQWVMRPQTIRLAEITAEMTDTVGRSMARMTPQERRALVARFNADDAVLIRPGEQAPNVGNRAPTLIEGAFLDAISKRLNGGMPIEWRADGQSRLWVHLWLGGEDWWVSLTPRGLRAPLTSTLIALGSALVAAITGGIALQRIIDKPLRHLVQAVDAFDPDHAGAPIAETGPQEIAAVAHAFNRMTARLAEQDAERAIMLGAVSHDLRTPLTRLRLCLAMMHDADAQLLETAGHQVNRIEKMLTQFLDFARGFEAEMPQSINLAEWLRHVVADGAMADCRTKDPISLFVAPDLRVVARPLALERAMANLIGNARRYGCAPYRIEANVQNGRVVIAMGDSGEGFDPALARSLCRPFARGSVARGGDATGLGLAIVLRIAEAHGGGVEFEHCDGMFWAKITIPQEKSNHERSIESLAGRTVD